MPAFEPLRVGGPRHRLSRALRRRRRVMAAGLAMTAAALAAGGAGGSVGVTGDTRSRGDNAAGVPDGAPPHGTSPPRASAAGRRAPVEMASAPVRIADAATVRLLRRGDRVDVIATPTAGPDGAEESAGARVVAAGARVTEIPDPTGGDGETDRQTPAEAGALVVLSVPRATAAELAGAGAVSPLAVTLC
ncbi:RcpC/CpaB family pilus assembly protein [Streptomyces sp. NPDC087420]|uniref:RcpC/CpaB family pilus assembly protein n=1 Tax=Streptomyces sp. NPDC087420 TaxID=3365785 RepID=UPI0038337105